jgi:hypothetical protein
MQEKKPDFYEVHAGAYEMNHVVKRFIGTPKGKARAEEYTEKFNAALQEAMGLSSEDMKVQKPDFQQRPEQYDLASKVEMYFDQSASVSPRYGFEVIGDDDPMPTDYPYDY